MPAEAPDRAWSVGTLLERCCLNPLGAGLGNGGGAPAADAPACSGFCCWMGCSSGCPSACAFRRSRPLIPTDRDHLFRSIATSLARVLIAPLDDDGDVSLLWVGQARREAAPVVHRRDPRSPRSALWLTQRRARGVPVDPPGRPENWACRSFLVSFCWLGWRTCARGGFLRG